MIKHEFKPSIKKYYGDCWMIITGGKNAQRLTQINETVA